MMRHLAQNVNRLGEWKETYDGIVGRSAVEGQAIEVFGKMRSKLSSTKQSPSKLGFLLGVNKRDDDVSLV